MGFCFGNLRVTCAQSLPLGVLGLGVSSAPQWTFPLTINRNNNVHPTSEPLVLSANFSSVLTPAHTMFWD